MWDPGGGVASGCPGLNGQQAGGRQRHMLVRTMGCGEGCLAWSVLNAGGG